MKHSVLIIILSMGFHSIWGAEQASWTSALAVINKMQAYVKKFINDNPLITSTSPIGGGPSSRETNYRDYNALHLAILNYDKEFLKEIIPLIGKLRTIKQEDKTDQIKQLINSINQNAPAGIHSGGGTPLHFLNSDDWTDIAQLLINNGADPNIKNSLGLTAFEHMYENKDLHKIAKILITKTSCENIKKVFDKAKQKNIVYDIKFIKENLPNHCDAKNFQ